MLNEYNSNDQLDYNTILLKHIDRISVLSTIIKENSDDVSFSEQGRRMALFQAISSLNALIPSNIKDKQYYSETEKEYLRYKKTSDNDNRILLDLQHRFIELGIIIDLLHRKGFILSQQISARENKKNSSGEDF